MSEWGKAVGRMDELDRNILRLLKTDGRMSFVKISEELGVPRPTVYLRVKNMEDKGVIRKFSVILGEEQVRGAFLKLKTYLISEMSERIVERVISEISESPEVDLIAKVNRDTLFVVWRGEGFNPKRIGDVLSVEETELITRK